MFSRVFATLAALMFAAAAAAQDIRGFEICTAEKTMERRTSCLQSNVEFLQQAQAMLRREFQDKFNAAMREVAAQKNEIAALNMELLKLRHELADLKKMKPEKK